MGTKFYVSLGSILLVLLICGSLYGCPSYNVYIMQMQGQANLAHAVNDSEVQVKQAQGKMEASKLLAQAEVERAKGAAQANDILMSKLGGPEGYLRYLFIQTLETRNGDTIYIPTEANLPILEARPKVQKP